MEPISFLSFILILLSSPTPDEYYQDYYNTNNNTFSDKSNTAENYQDERQAKNIIKSSVTVENGKDSKHQKYETSSSSYVIEIMEHSNITTDMPDKVNF